MSLLCLEGKPLLDIVINSVIMGVVLRTKRSIRKMLLTPAETGDYIKAELESGWAR